MKLKQQIKVMKHFLKGGKIEMSAVESSPKLWMDSLDPTWNWANVKYRIKKVPVCVYLNIYAGDDTFDTSFAVFTTAKEARKDANLKDFTPPIHTAVKVRGKVKA